MPTLYVAKTSKEKKAVSGKPAATTKAAGPSTSRPSTSKTAGQNTSRPSTSGQGNAGTGNGSNQSTGAPANAEKAGMDPMQTVATEQDACEPGNAGTIAGNVGKNGGDSGQAIVPTAKNMNKKNDSVAANTSSVVSPNPFGALAGEKMGSWANEAETSNARTNKKPHYVKKT